MSQKVLIAFMLLTLGGIASATTLTTPLVSTDDFSVPPVVVYNVANASDAAWVNGYQLGTFYTAGFTSDTAYAWLINYVSSTNRISNVVRRTISTATLANTLSNVTNEPFVNTNDTTFTGPWSTTYSSGATFDYQSVGLGLGYIAFATIPQDSNLIYQLQVNIIGGNSTTVSSVIISQNTNTAVTYMPAWIWWEDGYFYVVYVENNGSGDTAIWLQAVNAASTKTLYQTPVKVATISNSGTTPGANTRACAGSSNNTNSTNIYVLYKDTTLEAVQYVKITRSTGTVLSTTTLVTDNSATTTDYYPHGIVSSNSVTGALVYSQVTGATSYSIIAFYNGSTTSTAFPVTDSTGCEPLYASGRNYVTGFIASLVCSDSNDVRSVSMVALSSDGTVLIPQTIIAMAAGPVNSFTDASSAIWFGYTVIDTETTAVTYAGYLGKFLDLTLSGNVLGSFLVFLSIALVSLFIF